MKHEGDIAKLPKWAQRRIEKLERDAAYYRAKLAEGPEGSDTFADAYSEAPRPLGKEPTIEFRFGDGWQDKIQARLDGDALVVNGGDGLAVFPVSSNLVEIKALRRRP